MKAFAPFTARFKALAAIAEELALLRCPAAGSVHFASASVILDQLRLQMPDMAQRAALGQVPDASPTPLVRVIDLIPHISRHIEAIGLDPDLDGSQRRHIAARLRMTIDVALAVLGDPPPGFRPFDLGELMAPVVGIVDHRIADAAAEEAEAEEQAPIAQPEEPQRRRLLPFIKSNVEVTP